MEWLKTIVLVFYSAMVCNSQIPAIQHLNMLNVKVTRLDRHTNMLQRDIEDIWKVLSDIALSNGNVDTNKTNLDDSSTSEMARLFNTSIADMKDLKREVEQLVNYARKGFRREKALNRDAIKKITNSQNKLQ